MASKYRVSASFDLTTEIEPENIDSRIESDVEDIEGTEDHEGGSYFSAQTVTCDGGSFAFTVTADDEDEAEQKLRDVFDDGHEYEDYNGFTWLVESLSIEIETLEWEPTVDEAIEVLKDFVSSHIDEGSESGEGRVAKAAQVVLDDHSRLAQRVTTLEGRVTDLDSRITLLSERLQREAFTPSDEG